MPKTKSADLCYVFCAVEGAPPELPATGMPDGGAPRPLPLHATLTLVVAAVPADIYAAERLEPRLGDLDWVAAAGAAHHGVVDALAEAGAVVLPFRLFTLFSTDAKAVEALRARDGAMSKVFARIRGKQEWVLRIGKSDPARIEVDANGETERVSGTRFLQAKADARREAAARATRVKEDAGAAYEALEQLADEARTKPVDGSGTLMLDAAFLIPPDRVDAMRETLTRRAERLLRDGCSVSLTGPWPPYSFASMDLGNG